MVTVSLGLLVVDDSEDDALMVVRQFTRAGYTVEFQRVETESSMAWALGQRAWDGVVADVNMPTFSAAGALRVCHEANCDVPFLVVSGAIDEEHAVSLLKAGAHDFLLKSSLARLVPAFERERREALGRHAHREAEEALRASEERYALAAKGSNDGLWDWNLRSGRVYFSPRWVEMVGAAPGTVGDTAAEWFGRIHVADVRGVQDVLNAHLDGRSAHFAVEYRMRHADGGWRWMLARGVAVLDSRGIPCRMAGSQTDITAHRQALEDLRQAKDDMESAVAAKTRFLAAASHDMRQPMQALCCFASVAAEMVRGTAVEPVMQDLELSVHSLEELLDALLDVSKLDAGIVAPTVCVVELGPLLDQVAAEARPAARDKGLDLRLVESRAATRSDPVLLARILRNIVQNAVRYTDSGRILIGCRRAGATLRVEVWDTGVGIAEAQRGQIFEEFFQVGNPERDRRRGLGLGLAIVSRLSHLLSHPVTVRSALGRGSVFTVVLPLVGREPEPLPPPAVDGAAHDSLDGGGVVVVIDDEALVATAMSRLIRTWGFDVVTAGSVDDALDRVRALSQPPRAVVADYRLHEGRRGTEAIEGIRRLCGSPIPSLVVTGDTATDRLREFETAGLLVLHKPVAASDLRRALASVVMEPGKRLT